MNTLAIHGGAAVRTTPYPAWPEFGDRERELLAAVLESGAWWATEGTRVREFEAAFGALHDAPAVAVTNGTHGLELALMALGIGQGDEVIVPAYTFLATASAVLMVNGTPILVDVRPDTLCIDVDAVEAAITSRTAAVIAVHLAGHPADMDRLAAICAARGLALLEDCAHAHGAAWRDTPVGSIGDAGSFSFQHSKLMPAGEGGAVVSRREDVRAEVLSFSDCGRRPGEWFYSHFVLGGNYRMTEWQAAVLLAGLERFPRQHATRNENAMWLNEQLREIPGVAPQTRDTRTTAQGYYCYVVRIEEDAFGADRETVRHALLAEGIPLTMSYPPVHHLDCFRRPDGFAPRYRDRSAFPDYASLRLPETERAAAETLWFRHTILMGSRADAADVVEAVAKVQAHAAELSRVTPP